MSTKLHINGDQLLLHIYIPHSRPIGVNQIS